MVIVDLRTKLMQRRRWKVMKIKLLYCMKTAVKMKLFCRVLWPTLVRRIVKIFFIRLVYYLMVVTRGRFAGTEGTLKCLDVVQLCIMGMKDISVYIEALCIPRICSPVKVPTNECIQRNFKHLSKLQLAIPPSVKDEVDILIGLDYYFSLMTGGTICGVPGNPIALESCLGWIICGRTNFPCSDTNLITTDLDELDLKAEVLVNR